MTFNAKGAVSFNKLARQIANSIVKSGNDNEETKCVTSGCDNAGVVKGYCNIHYQRVKRLGKTDL